jgi:Flp pilus assembly pilin Flp
MNYFRKTLWSNELSSNQLRSNQLWSNEDGQDVAEYSIMLAVILVIVVGTVRLIGSNAGNVFSLVGSSMSNQ